MKLFLSSESTLRDISKEFQQHFPCLKLEFYRRNHQQGESSGRISKIRFIKLVLIDEALKAIIVNSFTQEDNKKKFYRILKRVSTNNSSANLRMRNLLSNDLCK